MSCSGWLSLARKDTMQLFEAAKAHVHLSNRTRGMPTYSLILMAAQARSSQHEKSARVRVFILVGSSFAHRID